MKKIILSLLSFSFVLGVSAQQIPERKTDAPMHEGKDGMRRHDHHGMDMKALNLTDTQKEQFRKEKESFKTQMESLKKNDQITVKEWREKMEGLRSTHKAKIDGILTPEQKLQAQKGREQGKAKQEDMMKKRSEMMKSKLGLTDEQSAKMDRNHKEMMEKMKSIREDKSLSEDKKREAMREVFKGQRESMKSILTEEQMKKMKEGKKGGHERGGKKPDPKEII